MPVFVEVLDPATAPSRTSVLKASRWLLKQLATERNMKDNSWHLEVFLVGDEFMSKNVLSFPHPIDFPRPDIKQQALGEIYLNPQYILDHQENLIFMLIHGFLHLLGYDHIKKSDRITMEHKEQELLSQYELSRRSRHRIRKY